MVAGMTQTISRFSTGGVQGVSLGLLFGENLSLRVCERILRTLAAMTTAVVIVVPILLTRL